MGMFLGMAVLLVRSMAGGISWRSGNIVML